MKEKILELKSLGYSYNKISQLLGCSKSLVCYYCGKDQKEKTKKRAGQKKWRILLSKRIYSFKEKYKTPIFREFTRTDFQIIQLKIKSFNRAENSMNDLTLEQFLEKYEGKEVKCYITGEPIDISKPRTYHFDHIIPKSKGGDNSINNLGICTKEANLAKTAFSYEDFVDFCKKVVRYYESNNTPNT